MNIIQNKKYFLGFSGTLVVVSWVLIAIFGLRTGIDLKGGTEWQIGFSSSTPGMTINEESLLTVFNKNSGEKKASVKILDNGDFVIRSLDIGETEHQFYLAEFGKLGVAQEKKFSSIGPTIGAELRRKSIFAIFAVLLAISLYIAWAFRKVSEPVKSWKYGVVTLVTLIHDVTIPTGLLAILGVWRGVEMDSNFIVALLVVMGFSVHDTIVVFDRIRENLLLNRNRKKLDEVINYSVKETMIRSINTSLTLILVLFTMLIWGPESLFYFILTILVGTIFGTYSSIFVASPLLFIWQKKQ